MKKLFLLPLFYFIGCSSPTEPLEDDEAPRTYADLEKCTKAKDGDMVYLPDDDARYLCQDGKWQLLGIVSSSSQPKSSSSQDQTSSESNSSSNNESSSKFEDGILTDSRDGKTYKTTVIGNQTWMAENLNYDAGDGSFCYDLAEVYCKKYGRLYTRNVAMQTKDNNLIVSDPYQGICPDGWHIPSYDEFFELKEYVDAHNGDEDIGKSLKSVEWDSDSKDAFGFSALGAGRHSGIGFGGKDGNAFFWSSKRDKSNGTNNYWQISRNDLSTDWEFLDYAHSVRCIKN